jgi:glycosyltransferase involved in cell wall biosynthesis
MAKLRVALVAPSLGILGGQAVQAARLIRAWQGDPDVEARLVPVNAELPPRLRFLGRVKFVRTVVNELFYVPRLVKELSRADVAHIFSASYSSFLLAPLPAFLIARLLGRPVVLNYRSGQAQGHLSRSWIARTVLRHADRNVVPSTYLVDVFNRFGIHAMVVPNIVDLATFTFRERDPLRPRLLSTRNFDALYNVAMTIRAFKIVQDQWPDASLTLVGGGPAEAELRALVDRLELRHVRFVGRVAPDAIAACYADHDIYIQSPNIDNMPTSVLEAFASGLPVVSTEAGGVPAIVTHGVHGLLAPLADHDTLGRLVLRLLAQPDFARAMARNAYATCQSRTWPNVRRQWLHAYRSVLPAHARIATALSQTSEGEPRHDKDFSSASRLMSVADPYR